MRKPWLRTQEITAELIPPTPEASEIWREVVAAGAEGRVKTRSPGHPGENMRYRFASHELDLETSCFRWRQLDAGAANLRLARGATWDEPLPAYDRFLPVELERVSLERFLAQLDVLPKPPPAVPPAPRKRRGYKLVTAITTEAAHWLGLWIYVNGLPKRLVDIENKIEELLAKQELTAGESTIREWAQRVRDDYQRLDAE